MSADFSMGKSVLHAVARAAGKSSERKRLLKLCVRKLQGIEDPETFLCRSVLINNTLRYRGRDIKPILGKTHEISH